MTLIEAIDKVDTLKPNVYTQEDKIGWLSSLDGMIKRDVIDRHEGAVLWTPYTSETDINTELLVGSPYEEMYITWLESKIDYSNSEYIKYNNSITRFNDTYQAFCNDYNRTHMPIGYQNRYF